jgi:hypothetical protein
MSTDNRARHWRRALAVLAVPGLGLSFALAAPSAAALRPVGHAAAHESAPATTPYVGPFHKTSLVASTVPANGDLNPYGVAVVADSVGDLVQGDVLVSNFNNSGNDEGSGSTVVQISPSGTLSVFAQLQQGALHGSCPGGVGLTTSLIELPDGTVIVGSLPSMAGNPATAKAGCLIVLSSSGKAVETISGNLVNGPWDMAAVQTRDGVDLFVTEVLNGTVAGNGAEVNQGTVVRIDLVFGAGGLPEVTSETVIGTGFAEETNLAALVIGPTGDGYSPSSGILYVADCLASRIAAIPEALTRTTAVQGGPDVSVGGAISGPLGLAMAPNGDILTVNGNNGRLVEVSPSGAQVATRNLQPGPTGPGSLFGLAVVPGGGGLYFVNDATNTLMLLH